MTNTKTYIRVLMSCVIMCAPAGAGVIYVDRDATGKNDGTTWNDAYVSLSAAIDGAVAGDHIWVAEGTYGPISLKSGVQVIGGFAGNESSGAAGDPHAHRTVISGGGTARAVSSQGNDSTTFVRGFVITDGLVEFPEMGGGLALKNSGAMFVNCDFAGNRSMTIGGAVAISGGSPTFVNCRFHDNTADTGAGAVITQHGATPKFVNSLFYKNTGQEAGAIFVADGTPTFINCTLADNHATIGKGGAVFDPAGRAVVRNCILRGNTSPIDGAGELFNYPESPQKADVTHSNIKGGWAGAGNIDADPVFVNAAQGDFRLRADSPCRDTGDNAMLPADTAGLAVDGDKTKTLPVDLGMKARIEGSAVDMGAFEWHPSE